MRISIWVRPGSAYPQVGGEYGGALVVRVAERAVDGKATDAALAALAAALGVQRRDLGLVAGARSRRKLVEITGADPAAVSRLLAGPLLEAERPARLAGQRRSSARSLVPARTSSRKILLAL